MNNRIFRREVIKSQRRRLFGDVIIIQPLPLRVCGALLLSVVIFVFAFLTFGSFSRAEKVSGYLVPDAGLLELTSPQSGMITDITFALGDTVRAGDVIAVVKTEVFNGDGDSSLATNLKLIADQKELLTAQMTSAKDRAKLEKSSVEFEIRALSAEIDSLERQIDMQHRIVGAAADRLTVAEDLLTRNHIAGAEVDKRRQDWLVQLRQHESLVGQKADRVGLFNRAKQRVETIATELRDQLAELKGRISQLAERSTDMRHQRAMSIMSSVDGVITSLNFKKGQAIAAGDLLAAVMPADSHLEASLLIPSRAAGFVEVGQEVRLNYAAFPYQSFGSFKGEVLSVDHSIQLSSSTSSLVNMQEPFYRARVIPAEPYVKAHGNHYSLHPGMLLEATIILERRSFLAWLLEPIRAVRERG